MWDGGSVQSSKASSRGAGLSMESFQTQEDDAAFVLRLGGTRLQPPRGWTRYPQHNEGRRMGCGPGRRGD